MLLEPAKESVDVCIVVRDIHKSLDFYQRILGLEKVRELETPYGTVHRLRFGTSLLKVMDPRHVPPAGPVGLEKQLGFRFVSFTIRDLAGACAALERAGVTLTMPATRVLPDLQVAMVADPDGNVLELVELG